jgi:hypothetical protein
LLFSVPLECGFECVCAHREEAFQFETE